MQPHHLAEQSHHEQREAALTVHDPEPYYKEAPTVCKRRWVRSVPEACLEKQRSLVAMPQSRGLLDPELTDSARATSPIYTDQAYSPLVRRKGTVAQCDEAKTRPVTRTSAMALPSHSREEPEISSPISESATFTESTRRRSSSASSQRSNPFYAQTNKPTTSNSGVQTAQLRGPNSAARAGTVRHPRGATTPEH